ncbi:SRPBCC domain-containing protein [Nonomuraea sp. K274]|uniref:SRPBCC domain-containing protein n=1 Tax=Nonomuraea cypriaca TaxID=1187855 RepID=A0A931AE64_9ACTN|nr:SRPBCC domain-containing protein [Nonomuraea cypriaca]MBF8191221.1 SRPBCC domain-containing protein [Nonomuraea cypriaca]
MGDTEFVIEPGRQDVIMIRHFDAPPEVVFGAVTDPGLIPRWWGPRFLTTRVDRMEVRPCGRWRYVNVDARGREYFFGGVYHDVVPPERFVRTWEFEGAPGDVALETVTLTPEAGGTRYTAQSVHQSVESRDAIIRADGPRGGRESMDRLAELLAAH